MATERHKDQEKGENQASPELAAMFATLLRHPEFQLLNNEGIDAKSADLLTQRLRLTTDGHLAVPVAALIPFINGINENAARIQIRSLFPKETVLKVNDLDRRYSTVDDTHSVFITLKRAIEMLKHIQAEEKYRADFAQSRDKKSTYRQQTKDIPLTDTVEGISDMVHSIVERKIGEFLRKVPQVKDPLSYFEQIKNVLLADMLVNQDGYYVPLSTITTAYPDARKPPTEKRTMMPANISVEVVTLKDAVEFLYIEFAKRRSPNR